MVKRKVSVIMFNFSNMSIKTAVMLFYMSKKDVKILCLSRYLHREMIMMK